jgi:hypothetical protein
VGRKNLILPIPGIEPLPSLYLVPCDAVNRNKVFNTSTRFYFSSLSLHVSAPMGHPQVRYTIGCFNGLPSNATDPLHVRDPMQRCYMLHIGAPTLHSQYMLSHRKNIIRNQLDRCATGCNSQR